MEEIRKPSEWREMLLQYRLNELGEMEREEFDTRLITDDEFAEAMQEAEYDLLDAYSANELSSSDRLRVEMALHPASRFSAGAPTRVTEPQSELEDRQSETHWPVQPGPFVVSPAHRPARRWLAPLGIAAAALLAAMLTLGHWRHRSSENPLASPLAKQTQPPNPATGPSLYPETPAPVNQPATKASRPSAAAADIAGIATLVLPPALRSTASLQLPIASGVRSVHFVWPLDAPAPGASYELQVVSEDGRPGCHSRGTQSRDSAATVSFSCPADALPSGTSFLRVMAKGAAPDDPPLIEVAVTVRKAH